MSVRLAGWLISGAMLGKLLGFVREIVIARLLGASLLADGLRGALTAVLLPVAPLQSDILPSVLIPLHREWRGKGDPAAQATGLAVLLTLLATLIAMAVFVFAAPWVGLLVGGFDAEAQRLTVAFVRVMTLAIPASVLSAVLSSIEIAVGTSRIAAIRASIQNIAVMGGIAVMVAAGQPLALPWSFVLAFNLIALYGVVVLLRQGTITVRGLRPGLLLDVGAMFLRRFRPMLAIPLADQGSILLERLLASGIATGALASLDYARTLTETTFYLVSQPLGYVMLTRAPGEAQAVRGEVERIARSLLALGVPASIFITVFATDIVRVVFTRGAFDEHAVALTTGALRGISVGLWAGMLGWVLVRMVNAAGRNGASAIIIVSAYATNALVNMTLVSPLGTLGLGLGEASRGLTLLAGAALVLGCGRLMLRCVGRAFVGAVVLACVGGAICYGFEGPVSRLAVGVPVFGLAGTAWLATAMPERARQLMALARNPRRLGALGARPS